LFTRWTERLDATEFERLLAHSGWLADLARRLVRDPAAADDLVQDTWHAALRRRGGHVANERGWLATLIANLARARARSENARRGRERSVSVSEAIDGPDRLVERAEAQKNLLAHVLALDEPYRSTLLARYAQGETSAEIARRTHVNESTVRTRIARAQEQLRERIERAGGGLSALAPILDLATSKPSAVAVAGGGAKGTLITFGAGVGIVGMALKIGVVGGGRIVRLAGVARTGAARRAALVVASAGREARARDARLTARQARRARRAHGVRAGRVHARGAGGEARCSRVRHGQDEARHHDRARSSPGSGRARVDRLGQ
jgi:RNA polymerase sigma-70 factor (ECF subfamily)